MEIKSGIYRHSKTGNLYKVLGTGRHSETLEEFVVYQALYESKDFGKDAIWIRPVKIFCEEVELEEKKVLRFQWVGDN